MFRWCDDTFSCQVFLYPMDPSGTTSDWMLGPDAEMNETIHPHNHPLSIWAKSNPDFITADPNKACVLIPAVTARSRTKTGCKVASAHCDIVGQWLRRLPFWDGGRNHAILDLEEIRNQENAGRKSFFDTESDSSVPKPRYAGFDFGEAIHLHSSTSRSGFRIGFDIAHAQIWPDASKYLSSREVRRRVDRNKLVCLSGCYSDDVEIHKALENLRDQKEVHLFPGSEKGAEGLEELLPTCKFGLIPPSKTKSRSQYFLEVMSAGAVPVIINDEWMLPYEGFIDWESLGIVVDKVEIHKILDIIRTISQTDYLQKHRRTVHTYELLFSSPESTIDTTLRLLKNEVEQALHRYRREVCLGKNEET